jgi:aspartyl aminopeptidase
LGKEPIEKGLNIIASHLDSPRLDLKPHPLYEDGETNLALLRTHYYGGLKKYHWTNIPLAMHGVVETSKGLVNITIGEDPEDPVFTIPDLLPHMAMKQERRPLMRGVSGEELQIIIGSKPIPKGKAKKDTKDRVKLAVLDHLNKNYGMTEEDLISAELEFIPAGSAREIGLDRSLIGSWGQDDKISSFLSIKALMECKDPVRPAMVVLFDKEEIGSDGPTGAKSSFLMNTVADIIEAVDPEAPFWKVRKALERSKALSTDVKGAINPVFGGVHERQNAAQLGHGITITKYTGRGGKGGANDANAEFVGEIRRLFNKARITWQPQETGKVDEGGGGTVAKFLAQHNMDVLDSGVPLLSMHSIFEVSSKQDVFEAYRAYLAFFRNLE